MKNKKNLLAALFLSVVAITCSAIGITSAFADDVAASADNEKNFGMISVGENTGMVINVNNADKAAFDFVIKAENPDTTVTADNSGSVLLIPDGKPAVWAKQTIPENFTGRVYVPFCSTAVKQWQYKRYNKVFDGGVYGNMNFTAISQSENVTSLLTAKTVSEREETELLALTTLKTEMFETGGEYAETVKPLLSENYKDGLYVKGYSQKTWIRFLDVNMSSTEGTYGVAFRFKNTSSELLRLQLFLMDETATEYTTSRWYDYPTDDFYLTFVNKDGSTERIYNKENFNPNTSSGSYLHIPANADGVLILPWNMILNYTGYYTFNGFTPESGEVNGRINNVNHFNFRLTNSDNYKAWEDGFFVGTIYSVNEDYTFTEINKPAENYSPCVTKYGQRNVTSNSVGGKIRNAATIIAPDTKGVITSASDINIYKRGYCFRGENVYFTAQYGYSINKMYLNGAELNKDEDGNYKYVVTPDDKGKTLTFTAEMNESEYQLGTFDVTDKTGIVFETDNSDGYAYDFTLRAVNGEKESKANGKGSALLVPDNGTAFWSGQTIPAGFKGKVYLPFTAAAQAKWKGLRNNVVFDNALSGNTEFNLIVEKQLKSVTFENAAVLTSSEENDLIKKTTLKSELFDEGGTYYEGVKKANGEYYKDGLKIVGTNPKTNQWIRLRNVNLTDTSGTLGVALRVVNLSENKLPFKLFAVTFNNMEIGTAREKTYEDTDYYINFVHKDGRAEKLYYQNNGYFYLPEKADGTVILPWNMMLGYQGDYNETENPKTDCGRIDSVYLFRILHGKDLSADSSWEDGFIVGSIYVVKDDGTFEKVYNPVSYAAGAVKNSVTASGYEQTEITINQTYGGGVKIVGEGKGYYIGDKITISANEGYIISEVTINGNKIDAAFGKYVYEITEEKTVINVTLKETKANVTVECNDMRGIEVSETGKLSVGTTVEISVSDGYEIASITLNGTPLTAKDGKYFYIVTDEDIEKELKIAVTVKLTSAEVSFKCVVLGGANISDVGKVAVGTRIVIKNNKGYEIKKVTLNGENLSKENGEYVYVVKSEDAGEELSFSVTAEKVNKNNGGDEKPEDGKGGCGAAVGVADLTLTLAAVFAVAFIKKKHGAK